MVELANMHVQLSWAIHIINNLLFNNLSQYFSMLLLNCTNIIDSLVDILKANQQKHERKIELLKQYKTGFKIDLYMIIKFN
jgi:hypothetical protein